jgi:hypothetical protein
MHGQQGLEQDGSEPHRLNAGEQAGKKSQSHPPVEASVPVHPAPEPGQGAVWALRQERLPLLVPVGRGLGFEEHWRCHHEGPAPDRPQDESQDRIRHEPPANRTPNRSFPLHEAILEQPPPNRKMSGVRRATSPRTAATDQWAATRVRSTGSTHPACMTTSRGYGARRH